MTESSLTPLAGWRYGIHPRAVGKQVRSLGRVELPLGEALRVEMGEAEPSETAVVHVQYYIWTDAGSWALWISCDRGELAARETALHDMSPPFMERP